MASEATIQTEEKPQVLMCGICETDTAVYEYTWEWGEKGYCGHTGKTLLEQRAKVLKRHISFGQLSNLPPPPMTRDERTMLKGKCYALEEEIKELQERGQKLYSELELARADARVVMSRDASQKAEIELLKAEVFKLTESEAELKDKLREATEQVQTLQRLIPKPAIDTEGESQDP